MRAQHIGVGDVAGAVGARGLGCVCGQVEGRRGDVAGGEGEWLAQGAVDVDVAGCGAELEAGGVADGGVGGQGWGVEAWAGAGLVRGVLGDG